ncbi:MAG: zf-HC2 domain-containing protein [Myxococcota bacterium]|nr:zf-HC2 domain-containing protein [Myxococcota bacterium]
MIWTHVSELAADRLVAGEIPPADAAAMRDHAATCVRCRPLLDDALAVRRTFVPPPLNLPTPMRWRRRIAVASTVLAAAVALLVLWPKPQPELVRTKGAAIAGYFVAHGSVVRRGKPLETVVPGDRIQLFTTTFARAWFAAYGDDAAGKRTIYIAPREVEAGRERVLPLAIELDATLGDEIVTAIFCDAPFDPAAPPAGCTIDRFTLLKVPR